MIDLKDKPVLQGSKIILRPFRAEDLEAMEECINDPEVTKFTGSFESYDRETLRNWYGSRNIQENRLDLAIAEKLSDIVIGEAVVNEYDEAKHSMNFRILIGPRGRDRGYGTEATRLMVDYIFQHTNLKQITLSVYAFNPRAKRVYEKVGFIEESIDIGELEYKGKWIDSINMVLTRENGGLRN